MAIDERQKDDFWDIAKLIPQKKTALSPFATEIPLRGAVDTAVPTRAPADPQLKLTRREEAGEETVTTYRPADNPLILSVTVRRREGGYSFYEQFRRDASRYFDERGEACDYLPFFSYTPQYTQLTPEQLRYYFYWREGVREGVFRKTDRSYFFLLVYEIINLPDRLPPPEGISLLCRLFDAYREALPGIERFLIAWIADYCLIHALPCPRELSHACLAAAAGSSAFQEFYFGVIGRELTPEAVGKLIALSSDYRFENGKLLNERNRDFVTRHIAGAMRGVFLLLFRSGVSAEERERRRYRAFSGSLCAHNIRADIEVEYISVRRAESFRHQVGLAVKHAENRLRALLSVRARLSVNGIPAEYREVVDRYFDALAPAVKKKAAPPPPAYEKLYDAAEHGFSADRADAIEAASWSVTRRLVPEEERAEEPPAAELTPPEMPTTQEAPPASGEATQERALATLLRGFLEGRGAAAAEAVGLPLPLAAERVNEAFYDAFGDVLLEAQGSGYALLPDYEEDALIWLKTIEK